MSSTHCVYLAGAISGLTLKDCTDWRKEVTRELQKSTLRVECLTPLRGKSFLADKGKIHSGSYDDGVISAKGITRRDMFDTLRSTAVFINLLGTKVASIGTCMEIAWAYQNQIPTVVVMEKDNLHNKHVMIQESCTYVVETLEEGIETMKWLLNTNYEE